MARVLFLCSRPLYPPIDGARVRMYNLARSLSNQHEVDVVAIAKGDEYTRPVDEFSRYVVFDEHRLRFYLRGVRSLLSSDPIQSRAYYSADVKRWVDDHVDDYDLVFCTHLAMAKYAEGRDTTKVLDFVDAVSNNFTGFIDDSPFPWNHIYRLEAHRAKAYETHVATHFDRTFITTESDREKIDAGNVSVVPNGVSASLFEYDRTHANDDEIVFLGDLGYLPNATAVTWFVDNIFHRIRRSVDDVTFKIVGKSPPPDITKLDDEPDITVTGFVDDPYEHVTRSRLSVAPVRIGGGIQNKVLESLALGTPVVTTTFGATGIDGEPDEHFLVRDDPVAFANAVCEVLENDELAHELGTNGRKLIRRRYTWTSVGEQLNEEVQRVLTEPAPHQTSDR